MEEIYNKVEELFENITKQITDIKKEIAEYCEKNIERLSLETEKKLAKTKEGRVPEGEKYWIITCDWDFAVDFETETNDIDDNYLYDIGNYFKTEEEAEQALEKIKIYTELKRFAKDFNTEEINWEDDNQQKFYIYYICSEEDLVIDDTTIVRDIGQIYFTSRAIANKAIEFIGKDNIKKLFI